MSKKATSVLLAMLIIVISMATTFAATSTNNSRQLMVSGNQLMYADDPSTAIRLTGVNIAGGEWTGTPGVERLTRSATEAINNWNCNFLRVPVSTSGWYGNYDYVYDGGTKYREYIDSVIDIASEAGVYVILDFHHYKAFDNADYLAFWQDAAVRYANNPTVLFGILNEPHSVGWDVWRDGNGSTITGHQQVVEMIRDLGAKNIIIAGGLDWGYSLTGIANGYALVDQGTNNNASKAGYGIMYDTHIYPWKGRTSNWDSSVGAVRKMYPIVVGECGWDPATNQSVGGKTYQPGDVMYHDKWVPELLNWMDDADTYGAPANYTAYCLHPNSSPRLLADKDNWKNDDYAYPPTDYWGVYVKAHLAQCESERKEGLVSVTSISVTDPITEYYINNQLDLSEGWLVVNYSDGSSITVPLTTDGVEVSAFDSTTTGTKKIYVFYKGLETSYNVTVRDFTQWAARATFDADSYIKFASNAFDVRWTGQTSEDKMVKSSADGIGFDGTNGLGFDYARTGGWGGVQTMTVPSTWNWAKTKYISFYAKIIPTTSNTSNKFAMTVAGPGRKCEFTATTEWQYFSFDLSDTDLTTATQLQWTINNAGAGKLVIDNLTISNYEITDGNAPVTNPDGVEITALTVSGAKTAYVVGDEFVAPTVIGTYSDGSTKSVTASFTGYDMSTPGIYTVTAVYQDIKTTYTITVESSVFAKTATFDADADIVFANNAFDIRWTGQTSADKISKTSANGEGIDGTNGLGFNYARTGSWGGVQTTTVPSVWNWERTKYISFYAKIVPTTDNSSVKFGLNIAGTSAKCNFEATTQWQYFSFDLSNIDLTTATQLQWTQNSNGEGKLIVDNLTISNYELKEGETPEPAPEPEPEPDPEPVTLTSISVSGQKTTYTAGDAFVKPTVTAKYSDGSTKTVTNATFSGYDMSKVGVYTVTVSYEGKTTTYQITVEKKVITLNSITISNAITVYQVGDKFVAPTVTAKYSDGTTNDVTATFTGYNMGKAGTYTVTASYLDKTATYTITVEEPEVILPDAPQTKAKTYLDLDFEDASYKMVDGVEDTTIIETTNKATGKKFAISFNPNKAENVYKIYSDSTTYIAPDGRKKNCAYDIRLEESVADITNKVYVDMRIKRVSYALDDPVSVAFTDDKGNVIFYINYTQSNIPTIVASQTYGVATPNTYDTDVTYPVEAGWRCVRAIIDFNTSTFQLYQGADFENMTGFVKGVETFSFKSAATNLSRITNNGVANRKGSLGFDDIKVYTEGAEEEERTYYVQQNFDDAHLAIEDYITDASTSAYSVPKSTVVKVNTVNTATGNNLPWYTYNTSRDVTSDGYLHAPYAIGTNDDGSTNYALMPNERKRQSRLYMTIDNFDSNGNAVPAPVYEEGKKTVVTMRVRRYRSDLDDPVTLYLSDESGNKIFSLEYKQNLYPKLIASASYGGEANTETSVTNYPCNSEWMYIKAEIDFDSKMFNLSVGETLDNMSPFITDTEYYGFANASARNLYKLNIEHKGSLGIDDFTVYTE